MPSRVRGSATSRSASASGERVIDERAHDALALAERALDHARRAGPTEAEALVMAEDAALTRFANSEIHQNVAETNVVINLRFVVGKRVGVASSGRTDDEGLRRLAERAAAIAHVVEEHPDWGGLPEPTPVDDVPAAYATATAAASPEGRADGVRAVIDAADQAGVTAYGSFATGIESMAVASSTGIGIAGSRTVAQLLTVSMGPAGAPATRNRAPSTRRPSTRAPSGASRPPRRGPRSTPSRSSRATTRSSSRNTPSSTSSTCSATWGSRRWRSRRSAASSSRGGRSVRSSCPSSTMAGIRLACPWHSTSRGSPSSGSRSSSGAHAVTSSTTRRPRREPGVRSTGHGLPAPNPYGPFPLNMVMAGGRTPRDELIAGLDRGLLVTRFHYTNPVHPKLAIITGMTRDGTFLVEDGRIVGPVRNLRFTQSYLDAMARVVAVAAERKTLKGFLGGVVVPALRIDGWTFTGTTEH